jgi:hypothetical protein
MNKEQQKDLHMFPQRSSKKHFRPFLGILVNQFFNTFLSHFPVLDEHYLKNFDVRNYFKTLSDQRDFTMKAV